jgi:hypothetical protein
MSIALAIQLDEPVEVWMETARPDRPESMVWRAKRWRVIDEPTVPDWVHWPTHPRDYAAWRITVLAEDDEIHVIDILRTSSGWVLVRLWD